MAMVRLTVRVRDEDNKIRVQNTRDVHQTKVAEAAQEMASEIQRSFSKLASGRRTDD
jgi:hypothetical protein